MAEFEFPCSQCGQTIIIDEEGAGMEIQCPGCQAPLIVPQPALVEPPKRLGLKKEAALDPAHTADLPMPEQSQPKKPTGKSFLATSVAWILRGAFVAIFVAGGYVVFWWVARAQALTRAHEMFTALGEESIQDWDRKNLIGFRGSAAETAKRMAPLLPKTPDLFKQECFTLTKITDANYRTAKLDALTGVISQFPPGSDLSPLLVIPASSDQVYKCARDKLVADAPERWLIKKSCDKDEQVRKLAADALKSLLPVELAGPEASLAARLSEQMPVGEKQKLFDQLCAAVAAIVEKRVAGKYHMQAEVVYRDDKSGEKSFSLRSKEPCLMVERRNLDWTFTFFGETWSGRLKDIGKTTFSVEIPTETFNNPYLANKTATLTLRVPDNALVLQVGPAIFYEPSHSDKWGFVHPSRPGFIKFECALVNVSGTGR